MRFGAKMTMNKSITEMVDTSLKRIKEMADVNVIIGDKIVTADGTTIIPVSKVSVGFASGGSDFGRKNAETPANFGGGVGSAMKITPVAFLVVSNGNVRILPVTQGDGGPIDRAVDLMPEIIDKISAIISKSKKKDEAMGETAESETVIE